MLEYYTPNILTIYKFSYYTEIHHQMMDMITIHGLEQNFERDYEWRSAPMWSNNSYTLYGDKTVWKQEKLRL